MKRFSPLLSGLLASAAIAAAPAPFPYFAANCFNCHGTEGRTASAIPPIAGRGRDHLAQMLLAFKYGEKPATIMHQLAKGYTDEEIAILADYFSRQKKK